MTLETFIMELAKTYNDELLIQWLKQGEAKYLKLKESKARPKKVSANKVLSTFTDADYSRLKQLVGK